jgi:hypothetical protein
MTIDEAIELLTEIKEWGFSENYGLSKEWYLRYEICVDMAIRSLEAWKELKNEREEWIKSDCSPYTPDVVKAYLKDIEVGE